MLNTLCLNRTVSKKKKNSRKSITLSLLRNLLWLQYYLYLLFVLSVTFYYAKMNSELIPGKSYEKNKTRKSVILLCKIWGKLESGRLNSVLVLPLNLWRTLEKLCTFSLLLSTRWRCQYQSTFLAHKKCSLDQINFCYLKNYWTQQYSNKPT